MSGRQHKKKRASERRIFVERFMEKYIAELRQILKRALGLPRRSHMVNATTQLVSQMVSSSQEFVEAGR